jgi:SseB protein N-terminal domain
MRRRTYLMALLGLAAASAHAQIAAPGVSMPPVNRPAIAPQNPLEAAFVDAYHDEAARDAFRRQLLESNVVLALASSAPDAPPREIEPRPGVRAALLFTAPARIDSVLGPAAPRVVLRGRAALERLRGKHVVINPRLAPMLVLEPEDVARYLDFPRELTGPTQ